jgi:hypothetical protein
MTQRLARRAEDRFITTSQRCEALTDAVCSRYRW